MICPLCKTKDAGEFHRDKNRVYFCCPVCQLIFVPPEYFLSLEAEKAEYENHQNSPDDPAYRSFLNRLFSPMQKLLSPQSRGLDFGSGPGPTLSVMFKEAGHVMAIYDPFYADDVTVFDKQYDFITATEVVEHLHHPRRELERLWGCLRPGGYLGIMTKLVPDQDKFADWHYINELSHVCFFERATFKWLARQWQARLTFVGEDVGILKKPNR